MEEKKLQQIEEHFVDTCILMGLLIERKTFILKYFDQSFHRHISMRVKKEIENILEGRRREIISFIEWLKNQEIKERKLDELIELLEEYPVYHENNKEFLQKFEYASFRTIREYLSTGDDSLIIPLEKQVIESISIALDRLEAMIDDNENKIKLHQTPFHIDYYYPLHYVDLMNIKSKISKDIAFITLDVSHIVSNKKHIEEKLSGIFIFSLS